MGRVRPRKIFEVAPVLEFGTFSTDLHVGEFDVFEAEDATATLWRS